MHGVWPFRGTRKSQEVHKQAERQALVRRLWLKLIREGDFGACHRYHFGKLARFEAVNEALVEVAREHPLAYSFPEYVQASFQWRVRLFWQLTSIVIALALFTLLCASPLHPHRLGC